MSSPTAKEKAKQIKKILEESREQTPTIQALSSEVNLDRMSLQHAFQELFGVTIARYGKQLKIQRIKELLTDYNLTLDTIAEMVGYNGAPALSRFFKQMEGVSPGVWRRKKIL